MTVVGHDHEGLAEALRLSELKVDQARKAAHEYRTRDVHDLLTEAESSLPAPGDESRITPDGSRRIEGIRLRIAITRTWVSFEEVGLEVACAQIARLAQECRQAGRDDLVGVCHMVEGLLRGRSADAVGALAAMHRAEASREAMAVDDQARLMLNRGALGLLAGTLSQSLQDLAAAGDLAGQAGLPSVRFKAMHNQGYVEFLRGDLPRALHLMQVAGQMDVGVQRGVSCLDRARVMLEAGLVDEAHDALEEAARITVESGGRHDLGEIALDLARADLLTGDADRAAQRAAQARKAFRRRRQNEWRRSAQAVELEALALDGSAPRPRCRLAAALATSARAAGDDRVALRASLLRAEALVDDSDDDLDEAVVALAEARELMRSPHLATRMYTRYVSARIDAASGRLDSAARVLGRAARDLGAAQRNAPGLDLRTALAVHGDRLVGLDLDLAMRSGSVARVLTRTEVWRDVVRALPPAREGRGPGHTEQVGLLRKLREDLRAAPPGTDTTTLRARVSGTETSVRELDWATEGAGEAVPSTEPLTARDISRAVADAGATLLSYFTSRGQLYGVLVRPDGRRTLHEIGGVEEITSAVRTVRSDLGATCRVPAGSPLRAVVQASLTQSLAGLDALLLGSLLRTRAARSRRAGTQPGVDGVLVLVPTPVLMTVPWGMLPSRRGRPTSVVRSATSWVTRHTLLEAPPEVTALAGPEVPMADAEVRGVVAAWGRGRAVPAAESRAADLVPALTGSDVVHVAAHGEHHTRNPLFSSLRLGDGVVFAHEIEGSRLRASHVVLSACDGGRVTVRRGDEPLGMTVALLALGVATVVAPVSVIPDEVAHDTMGRYHGELASGADAGTALARATGEGDLLAASFTCFGAPWRGAPAAGAGAS